MLVCHCKRVSDGEIRQVIEGGARCCDSVGRACGAGTGCGGCLEVIEELLDTPNEAGARRSFRPTGSG